MAQETKARQQADPRWVWNLGDIFADHAAWDSACEALHVQVRAFATHQGTLAQGPARILTVLDAYQSLARDLETAASYAHLFRAQDNGDPTAQAMVDRINTLAVEGETVCSFLRPELLTLPEATLIACAHDPAFAAHRVYLKDVLRYQPHTLSGAEEKLLAAFSEVTDGCANAAQMLMYVDLRFPNITDANGESVALTEGRYGGFIQSPDRRVREQAMRGILETYATLGNTLAATYANTVKRDIAYAKARGFSSARAASLFPDEVPEAVYDSLIAAVRGHLPDLARYVALRKQALGIDTVHLYDLYAPMSADFDLKLPFEQAYAQVIEGVSVLGEAYADTLREACARHWIDVYENRGKTTGAFCSGCYGVHPYVLLNFEPGLHETLTIAHEMGHAMHSYYSDRHNCYAQSHYEIFVAEVASTVNEVLLLRHLMQKHQDKAAQVALINRLLENFRTTVFRQTLFAEFEHQTHQMAERGEALTRESLSALYYGINQAYYGAEAEVDDFIANEWMRIPHFYNSFYVYKYATGFSAAVAIADRLLSGDAQAKQDYLRFLTTGGSMPPIEELKIAGVDMSTPEPVQRALAYFTELLGQFEKLL